MNARQEWLAARRQGIGGSDAAAILGASRWRTRADVWLDKTGQAPESVENAAMHWGTVLEPVIRKEYEQRTGSLVMLPEMMQSTAHPFMLANLDGIADGKKILEIKTARTPDGWGEPGTDEVPLEYAAQVHHYMIVTGYKVADVAVLIGGSDFRIYTVEADKELHQAMIEREREFWHMVETMTMPEPVDVRETIALFAKDNGATIQATDQVKEWADRLADIKASLKDMETDKEELEDRIKHFMGAASNLEHNGVLMASWKASKDSSRFDADAFKKAYPELYSKFQKPIAGSRRFILK